MSLLEEGPVRKWLKERQPILRKEATASQIILEPKQTEWLKRKINEAIPDEEAASKMYLLMANDAGRLYNISGLHFFKMAENILRRIFADEVEHEKLLKALKDGLAGL